MSLCKSVAPIDARSGSGDCRSVPNRTLEWTWIYLVVQTLNLYRPFPRRVTAGLTCLNLAAKFRSGRATRSLGSAGPLHV